MLYHVDPDFQRRIDEWNRDHPGPARIAVAWHPLKERWMVFAIPQEDSPHPLARHNIKKLCRPFPDGSGQEGVILFTWAKRDAFGSDTGYAPLDERLFEVLDMADSFKDRQHFENTIEASELRREQATNTRVRDIAYGAKEYWANLDSLTISMNPSTHAPGDWRHRIR